MIEHPCLSGKIQGFGLRQSGMNTNQTILEGDKGQHTQPFCWLSRLKLCLFLTQAIAVNRENAIIQPANTDGMSLIKTATNKYTMGPN